MLPGKKSGCGTLGAMLALRNRSLSKEMLELSGLSQQITLSSTTSMVDWLEKTIRILKKDNLESLVMVL